MILNAISGYSASARPKEKGVAGFLDDVLKDMPDKPEVIHRHTEFSSNSVCIADSVRWINSIRDDRLLLVGKSMGGVKTWWMIYQYWSNILAAFKTGPHSRLGVVLIDPHGWQRGDGRVGSYGVELDDLRTKDEWKRDDVKIRCLYQKNKYPKGVWVGSKENPINVRLGDKATHWNVEDFNTETGKTVGKEIQDMIRWVTDTE